MRQPCSPGPSTSSPTGTTRPPRWLSTASTGARRSGGSRISSRPSSPPSATPKWPRTKWAQLLAWPTLRWWTCGPRWKGGRRRGTGAPAQPETYQRRGLLVRGGHHFRHGPGEAQSRQVPRLNSEISRHGSVTQTRPVVPPQSPIPPTCLHTALIVS